MRYTKVGSDHLVSYSKADAEKFSRESSDYGDVRGSGTYRFDAAWNAVDQWGSAEATDGPEWADFRESAKDFGRAAAAKRRAKKPAAKKAVKRTAKKAVRKAPRRKSTAKKRTAKRAR